MKNIPANMIAVGSPVVDLVLEIQEKTIARISGEKGGMELVEACEIADILEMVDSPPVKSPGGSAGNTAFALAKMGLPCAFVGKIGTDEHGDYYMDSFRANGGDCSKFKIAEKAPTACCASLVTPDSERTMRTALGSAMQFSEDDIHLNDFEKYSHAHIEGYLLFNEGLTRKVLATAKSAGCSVSLDLGSFEVVKSCNNILKDLLDTYVDMVFANEDEAEAFCGDSDPEASLKALGECCEIAAVKMGDKGALIKDQNGSFSLPAIPAENAIDSTGAGDYWAAGFLYSLLNGHSSFKSGVVGSLLGKYIVEQIGTNLSDKTWQQFFAKASLKLGKAFF